MCATSSSFVLDSIARSAYVRDQFFFFFGDIWGEDFSNAAGSGLGSSQGGL